MIKLFILVTPRVQEELNNLPMRVIIECCQKTFFATGDEPICGKVVLLQGYQQDFNKLLESVGELWMCTHPFCDQWVQHFFGEMEAQG